MDSNNTTKQTTDLDIRDIVSFLLTKLWIIALVVLCFAIIAFLWTTFFVTRQYTSTTDLFIINTSNTNSSGNNNSPSTSDWSIGKQLTKTSSELIKGNYCDRVAAELNAHTAILNSSDDGSVDLTAILNGRDEDENGILQKGLKFSEFFTRVTGNKQISGSYIRSCINVASDDETCIVSVTATTIDPQLSAAISNVVMELFGEYIIEFMKVDTIVTEVSRSGKVPTSASNANATRNAIIFGAIGAVLVCALLVVIFIFDDKIKTPDDIEKQLKLSVLGAIPEIEEA